MAETRIFTDLYMSKNKITDIDEIVFDENQYNKILNNSTGIMLQGNNTMILYLNDPNGVIYVYFCDSFAPGISNAIDLGNALSKWKKIWVGSEGIQFNDGTIQTTAGGGASAIHTHSGVGDGGENLAPKTVLMSVSSAARFRLPVGTNMY